MTRSKKRRKEIERARAKALEVLRSPDLLNRLLVALEKLGLVGEERNALVLYIVASSRFRQRPLNAIIKGPSSVGKNWLASRVLKLLPKKDVREISSTSARAWNYAEDNFEHRVIYLQERNEASGGVHPARLFISEGKLIRTTTERCGRGFVTTEHVARGPIAFISTTTKNRIEIDDETRHISLFMDDSAEQTGKIVASYGLSEQHLSADEILVWRQVQQLLQSRARGVDVTLPGWFQHVKNQTYKRDVRVRRYFPAFVEACATVCLLRSFQRYKKRVPARIDLNFTDFAVAAVIFDSVFSESLHHRSGETSDTGQAVERIVTANGGRPVEAKALARHLGISKDRAYSQLRRAAGRGTVRRVNPPEKSNRKFFLPSPAPRFIPDPKDVFKEVWENKEPVKFLHPLTGKWVVYGPVTPCRRNIVL